MRQVDIQKNIIDRAIEKIAPQWGVRRLRSRYALSMLSGYKAADITRIRDNWILPGMGGDKATATQYDLSVMRARSRDANRNDPVASGATDTMKTNIIGNGLKPQSKIRAKLLGISEDRAKSLRRQAETAWDIFAPMADASNRMDIDEMQFLALAKIIEDGETIVIPTWANESWRPFGRCLEIIESERLASPSKERTEAPHGIVTGKRGQPESYWIKKTKQKVQDKDDYLSIKARDSEGRPKILHIFPVKRPGQTRGVPFFAPVLSYFKDLADYMEAEVVAARVAACLAVFITKGDPMAAAMATGTGTETDTNERVQSIEPGMVSYLNFNESINTVDPKRPGDAFGPFIESILRIIGISLGLPYELIAKDFSKTNYSSARASLLEGRRMFTNWRNWFSRKFCRPVWDMILEEAYLRGMFDAPDFYKFKHEYSRVQWIGGGWGWVDPVKEVDASKKAVDYGLSTLAEEAAAQGRDWEEVLEQKAREEVKAKDLKLELGRADQTKTTKGEENGSKDDQGD